MADKGIRRASREDVGDCARIIATWAAQTDWIPEELPEEKLADLILEAFPNRDIWIAGDPIDCYMSVDPVEHKVGALYCLRTGQGIGKQLLDKAKEGRDHLWLTTHVPNVDAQRFYRREGFVETGREPPVPPDTVPVIRMEWHA
ncbi:GNAT family N-acetyltransferase [Ruegeria sp. SCSIO 43209]|jgi:GNAT superfamily N-acetyltransferase|uniref:GNAT family N-acetyltransferase n=1 Tax=Ruegeria sp. SCSIO 43209 TaxID=2793010 RepID=UPI001481A48B|nr:GNAT family N-acetyltransferase [Ruegeria sp. SCSIO 43209]UAB90689.1 GNAT family N-acetyltransferase [Ruegeria sp. SCSIO 43209]